MERTKKWWAITSGGLAAAALTGVVALAAPAAAAPTDGSTPSSSTTAPASGPDGHSASKPKYCDRIDRALDRHQRIADRWNGDASQRGSIAWLQARAAKVATTNPQLSTLLTDIAARRSQDAGPAATVVADLEALRQARCG